MSPSGNGHSRIYGSPVMRRVRRAGPPSTDPTMRKSVSLTNVDVGTSKRRVDTELSSKFSNQDNDVDETVIAANVESDEVDQPGVKLIKLFFLRHCRRGQIS
jgi:hypothetical protein